jgi:arsenite methyltransferase
MLSVNYNTEFLKILPEEIIERDYGCGDPSQYVNEGEVVLDLGSGGGKICYIASQVVGKKGKVIGVDMTDDMLALAEKYKYEIGEKIGYHNVEFRKGNIQDLALDLNKVEKFINENPVTDLDSMQKLEAYKNHLRKNEVLVEDNSIDVIVSNCVLNLVSPEEKKQLFGEMFRVLKKGGRCVISDIVSDEPTPMHLQENEELWSGCISGAFEEAEFLQMFEDAGFHAVEMLKLDETPWQVVEGIEYRSMTVQAYKGKQGPCLDRNQAVIYKGPWKAVVDDDGHTLYRGERMAVCEKTLNIYKSHYGDDVITIEPKTEIPLDDAKQFDCKTNERRDPKRMKVGEKKKITVMSGAVCDPDSGCC